MDIAFLVAIFLMTRKTEDSYRRVLTFVREQLITWPVVRITTDFEVALINASKRIFPGAQHQGCWFHFTQIKDEKQKSAFDDSWIGAARGDTATQPDSKAKMVPHITQYNHSNKGKVT
ncbi:uncharacterized protein LOC120350662 [Nilaparvata lugens]|uniref:uncharacterized protein LOC120350662 n=1 Tax=Nilaparvata lugens TaxID=108931 RepID=UPI00193D2C96|nr:uncharacterized protein LOC120350662 [Nilaparvata lugens]